MEFVEDEDDWITSAFAEMRLETGAPLDVDDGVVALKDEFKLLADNAPDGGKLIA